MDAIRSSALATLEAIPSNQINQLPPPILYPEYQAIGLNVDRIQIDYILRISGYMLLLTLLGTIASIIVGLLCGAQLPPGLPVRRVAGYLPGSKAFPIAEFDKFTTASLITRSTNDIQQMQMVLGMMLRMVFYAPIIGIGAIILALGQNVSMVWIIGARVLVLVSMIFCCIPG